MKRARIEKRKIFVGVEPAYWVRRLRKDILTKHDLEVSLVNEAIQEPARAGGLLRRRLVTCTAALALTLFAISVLALMSIAIEYGHALKIRSEIQQAADLAVKTAAVEGADNEDRVTSALRTALDSGLRRDLRGLPFAFTLASDALTLQIQTSIGTRISAGIGKSAFNFRITSVAPLSAANAATASVPAASASEAPGDEDAEIMLERGASSTVVVVHEAKPNGGG